jgi:hypothetical protein
MPFKVYFFKKYSHFTAFIIVICMLDNWKSWMRISVPVPGSLDKKKAEEDATYYLIKDATLFPIFCLTNPAQANV